MKALREQMESRQLDDVSVAGCGEQTGEEGRVQMAQGLAGGIWTLAEGQWSATYRSHLAAVHFRKNLLTAVLEACLRETSGERLGDRGWS